MNQAEYTSSDVLRSVSRDKAIPIEQAGSAKEVADRVRQGKAFLKIVSAPWGVEFYVVEVGKGP